jgi:hypothetical protein
LALAGLAVGPTAADAPAPADVPNVLTAAEADILAAFEAETGVEVHVRPAPSDASWSGAYVLGSLDAGHPTIFVAEDRHETTLVHELVHVLQEDVGSPLARINFAVGYYDQPHEEEAFRVADRCKGVGSPEAVVRCLPTAGADGKSDALAPLWPEGQQRSLFVHPDAQEQDKRLELGFTVDSKWLPPAGRPAEEYSEAGSSEGSGGGSGMPLGDGNGMTGWDLLCTVLFSFALVTPYAVWLWWREMQEEREYKYTPHL